MAWADVPAKLTQWSQEEYYMTDGLDRLNAEFGVTSYMDVPPGRQADYEARLDYYLAACINLRNSRAIPPEKLIGGSTT